MSGRGKVGSESLPTFRFCGISTSHIYTRAVLPYRTSLNSNGSATRVLTFRPATSPGLN
jgi:hypothetical protein